MVMLRDRFGDGRIEDNLLCRSLRQLRRRVHGRRLKADIRHQRTGLQRQLGPGRRAVRLRGPLGVARAFYGRQTV